jgi:hypothetical protein
VEGLAILGWALNHLALPPHDEPVDPYTTAESVGLLSEDPQEYIESARLRDVKEMEAYREVIYAIHCRLRSFARDKKPVDFARWVDMEWLNILGISRSYLIVQGDLSIGGRAIHAATTDRLQICEWITYERHKAIIWLLDGYPIYSKTPVGT